MRPASLAATRSAGAGADTPSRLLSIDAARYACLVPVIYIHVLASDKAGFGIDMDGVIIELCRFAVPFFFIAAGYFLRVDPNSAPAETMWLLVKKIIPTFLLWMIFYVLVLPPQSPNAPMLKRIIVVLATGGPGYHLWFLPTFVACMGTVLMARRYLSLCGLIVLSAALYCVGLLIGSYAGLWNAAHRTSATALSIARGGPFFGTIFVVAGVWLAQSGWRPRCAEAAAIFAAGAVLQLTEAWYLARGGLAPFTANDFLGGTLLLGTGAFLLALQLPTGGAYIAATAHLGRYTLGIYAVHLAVVIALKAYVDPAGLAEKLSVGVAALVISTLATLLLRPRERLPTTAW